MGLNTKSAKGWGTRHPTLHLPEIIGNVIISLAVAKLDQAKRIWGWAVENLSIADIASQRPTKGKFALRIDGLSETL